MARWLLQMAVLVGLVVAFFLLVVVSFVLSHEDFSTPLQDSATQSILYKHFHASIPPLSISCPYCDLKKCKTKYCFTKKIGLRGEKQGSECGGFKNVSRLLREPLLYHQTDSACQAAKGGSDHAVCWCKKPGERTVEDELRDMRVWRFESLLALSRTEHSPSSTSSSTIALHIAVLGLFLY